MSLSFDPEIVSAFVLEAQLTLAPIASALKSRLRDAAELEPELEDEMLRSTVAVEQTAGFLGLNDVSRLSCAISALLNAKRRGEIGKRDDDMALLTRAFDRLHDAVSRPERHGDAGVGAEIAAIRARLTSAVQSDAGFAR
jgi:chemotaxis protein histidine kinase CheA